MKTAKAVVVAWHGPYGFDDACALRGEGLYMVWGRHRMGRNPSQSKLLYVGISENRNGIGCRIRDHAGRGFDHPNNYWWIGNIVAPEDDGRDALEAAEWMLIHFAGAEHNDKKAKNPPSYRSYLINEWYFPAPEYGRRTRMTGIMTAVPSVMTWSPDSRKFRMADRLDAVDADG